MYFITTKRMLEVCFSAHPNIQYRTCFYFCFYAERIFVRSAVLRWGRRCWGRRCWGRRRCCGFCSHPAYPM